MAEITSNEIIETASGEDDMGFNKSAAGLFFEIVGPDGQVKEKVDEVDVDKPIINIHKNLKRVFVDLIFSSKLDTDFNMMNDLMLKAFQADKSVKEDGSEIPLVSLSIIPHAYDGKYYILCTDPMFWALTSQSPRGDIDTLRMVFDEEDVYFIQVSDEALNQMHDDIEAEVAAEQREADFYAQKDEERRARMR